MKTITTSIASLLLILSTQVAAEQSGQAQPCDAPEYLLKCSASAISFHIGNFSLNDKTPFDDVRRDYATAIAGTYAFKSPSYLALDIELFYSHSEFDTPIDEPFLASLSNDSSISTLGLLTGVRFYYPIKERFELYLSGGVGFFQHHISAYANLVSIPVYFSETRSDTDLYYGFGAAINMQSTRFSLNYRRFSSEASFDEFEINRTDLGGDTLMLGVGYRF